MRSLQRIRKSVNLRDVTKACSPKGTVRLETLDDITVVIPSLNPDETLLTVVNSLREVGFTDLLLVNDGSDAAHGEPFRLASEQGCVVLTHEKNRGKGAALRTAFDYCVKKCPASRGVITVDGDGQHKAADVRRLGEKMAEWSDRDPRLLLGVRDFSLPDIPPRSVFGNRITSMLFRVIFGLRLTDTQTGLRAIPASLLPMMLNIRGDRYEYETNMLLECHAAHLPIEEMKIETVYENHNAASHFNPFFDSLRIYGLILKFCTSSLLSFLVDIAAFYGLIRLLDLPGVEMAHETSVLVATVGARVVSSVLNFFCNQRVVFRKKQQTGGMLLRYYALAIPQMLVSAAVVGLISSFLNEGAWLTTLLKVVVDTVLFLVSFRIQRQWVFREKKNERT